MLKVRCSQCGSGKVIFTQYNPSTGTQHGAICGWCYHVLSWQDLLPITPTVEPVAETCHEREES